MYLGIINGLCKHILFMCIYLYMLNIMAGIVPYFFISKNVINNVFKSDSDNIHVCIYMCYG